MDQTRNQLKIVDSILDLIGNIPLVRLSKIPSELDIEILVKPEYLNPSGSIKDRVAVRMVSEAEATGALKAGDTIVEASSGNTATALALVAAVKGYKFVAYVPDKISDRSRIGIIRSYGCETVSVDTDAFEIEDATGRTLRGEAAHRGRLEFAGRKRCREAEAASDTVWWARQYSNPAAVEAHESETGREIVDQTDGNIDGFVATAGTGGTLLGIARTLKQFKPDIAVWGVEPAEKAILKSPQNYPLISGISGGITAELMGSDLIDDVVPVTRQAALDMSRRLAAEEGLFCGVSAGANVVAALRLGEKLGPGHRVVTVLPDSRDRYLETEDYIV